MLKIQPTDDGNFFIDQPGKVGLVISFATWHAIGQAMLNGHNTVSGCLFIVPPIQSPFDRPSSNMPSTIDRLFYKLAQLRRRLTASAS